MAKVALRDVNLIIEDGEFVGLIGHTGSGKSTLVQHLNGLLMPTSGKVYVDGVDLTDKHTSLRAIRQKVGMVFQYPEHQLFGETVYEDVAFPRKQGWVSKRWRRSERSSGHGGLTRRPQDHSRSNSPVDRNAGSPLQASWPCAPQS